MCVKIQNKSDYNLESLVPYIGQHIIWDAENLLEKTTIYYETGII